MALHRITATHIIRSPVSGKVMKKIGMKKEELIKKLAHEDSDVRNSAVQALGQIGKVADEVVPNLIQLLQNEDKDCRRVAARALGQAGEGATCSDSIIAGSGPGGS